MERRTLLTGMTGVDRDDRIHAGWTPLRLPDATAARTAGMGDGEDLRHSIEQTLDAVCRRIGARREDAELLHLHSNAVYRITSAGVVVRIALAHDAANRIATSLRVTRWLAARGVPTVEPADEAGEQPLLVNGHVVSVWRLVDAPPDTATATAYELGQILRTLHAQPEPPFPVPTVDDPFARLRHETRTSTVLSDRQRAWLLNRADELGRAWKALRYPHPPALVHGDAHPGNLLRTRDGRAVLCDWDGVALGHREWDLVQVHYTCRRFGRPTTPDLDTLAEAYGWDIRDWPGLDTLIAIRELSGLSPYLRTAPGKPAARREVAWRLKTLMRGDVQARWRPPGS
ncbi:Aminoglycoside phosphotransferase [Carbonactinospora thermoautotrophica]|uniref:Aminoglycoside phosphotransferase n=1 Tax=Carbonactinospora thermoautotrophica TaxID=1469144 RepID=A0A132MVK1_9ACTN|nr:aminoglycoside phosphotransferase family protein [Carbonactinospora thermoautotrophica]KWX01402.1 Aminoglycoside phosphotransferase [Carbonactinospora thermoautotrophica]